MITIIIGHDTAIVIARVLAVWLLLSSGAGTGVVIFSIHERWKRRRLACRQLQAMQAQP